MTALGSTKCMHTVPHRSDAVAVKVILFVGRDIETLLLELCFSLTDLILLVSKSDKKE